MASPDPAVETETSLPADPPVGLRLVFLIGMPRSGTTWVTWLLTHHPAVVTFRHSGIFFCFDHLQRWWKRDIHYTKGGAMVRAADGAGAAGKYATSSSAATLAEADLDRVLRGLASHVTERLTRETPGARVFLDQTPEHISLFPFVQRVFPEARFLHVVRDPRAVYSSIRSAADTWAKPGSFPRSPIQIARRWRKLLSGARALRGSDKCYELHYERIHAAPEVELERLHRWLGLDTDPALVAESVAASDIEKLREHGKNARGFFRRGSAHGWREELSASEIRCIEHEAGDEMREWGYELLNPRGAAKPLRVRAYDRVARFVRRKNPGRLMRFFDGALARTNRSLDLMRSE